MSAAGVIDTTGEQTYTGTVGQNFTNDAQFDNWGVTRTSSLHLVTKYTVYSTSATINSVNTTGTQAWFPESIGSTSTSILTNNARVVTSRGDYTIIQTCPNGWGTCGSYSRAIETTVNIKYAGNGSITFTVKSDYLG